MIQIILISEDVILHVNNAVVVGMKMTINVQNVLLIIIKVKIIVIVNVLIIYSHMVRRVYQVVLVDIF